MVLIYLSKGLELLSDGQTLTSKSHGLSFSSKIISKPYNSKQAFLCLVYFMFVTICGSTAMIVFIITSLILSKISLKSKPNLVYS